MTLAEIIQLIVAAGGFTAVAETVRWFLGRKRGRVDEAKVIQGMALQMLQPLNSELSRTVAEVEKVQQKCADVTAELETVLMWAIAAKAILDAHDITYPPVPEAVKRHVA